MSPTLFILLLVLVVIAAAVAIHARRAKQKPTDLEQFTEDVQNALRRIHADRRKETTT